MDQVQSMYQLEGNSYITNDFFGIFKAMDLDSKKTLALETYKLIFRFSIEKLIVNLEDDSFITVFLQYLFETQLRRINEREVLLKNHGAYYRAIENMLNFSSKQRQIFKILLGDDHS